MNHQTKARFNAGGGTFLAILVLTFIISAGVRTGAGRDVNNHPGPRPPGVVRLTGNQFLFESGAAASPQAFCHGAPGNTSPVDSIVPVPQLRGALFVTCYDDQSFNDHRPLGKGFFQQLAPTALDPGIEIGLGVAALVCMLPFLMLLPGDWKYARLRKEEKALAAQQKLDRQNAETTALASAFAKGEIESSEYEAALDKLWGIRR